MKKKIVVRGPALTQSGYGEHTRFVLRALRSREELFDIYFIPIIWGKTNWLWEDNEERKWIDSLAEKTIFYMQSDAQFDISVQVTIPNEWEKIAPINIGVTAGVETTKVTPQWIEKSYMVDKIITISEHSKQTYQNSRYDVQTKQGQAVKDFRTQVPFHVIHYPVKNIEASDLKLDLKTDFNFITVAQWGVRKNLDDTIRWFVEEFIDQEVGLIVKTNLAKNCLYDRLHCEGRLRHLLEKYPQRKCKIYFVHGHLSEEEMTAIYQDDRVKAYATLTHGEGFGLPIFEAAYNGLPIIAPAWSGHVDFLYMPVKDKKGKTRNKPMFSTVDYTIQPIPKESWWEGVVSHESSWCVAEQGHFKMRLREIYKDYNRFASRAKKLRKWVCENFEEAKQMKLMAECLYGEKIVDINVEDIPKISLITSVFKAEEHIEQLLEDVTEQTIFKEKCEWIILNANPEGDDVEEEAILKYVEKYPDNIVYKRLEEDPGVYAVWNMGIKMSSGEYITNINCDDRRATYGLEAQAKALMIEPDISLVYNDSYIVHEANVRHKDLVNHQQRYNFENYSKEAMLRGNLPHNNPMWRRELHDKYGYFDEKYRSAADWDFWLRCAFGGEKFEKLGDVLGVYYFNPKGISTNFENFSWKQKEEQEIYNKYKQLSTQEDAA